MRSFEAQGHIHCCYLINFLLRSADGSIVGVRSESFVMILSERMEFVMKHVVPNRRSQKQLFSFHKISKYLQRAADETIIAKMVLSNLATTRQV